MAAKANTAVFALAAVGALALAASGTRRSQGRAPPARLGGGLDDVWAWGMWVESLGALPGFATFASAAARTESRGDNLKARGLNLGILPSNVSLNKDKDDSDAACSIWKGASGRGYYEGTPYDSRYWCFGSGGWFQFLPAVGLAAGGTKGPFQKASPFLVFDPIESMVMMADFAKRIIKGKAFRNLPYGEQNWLAVRRGMAATTLVQDYDESVPRSVKTRERFHAALVDIGADPDFMWTRAEVGDYPGAKALLDYLYGLLAA